MKKIAVIVLIAAVLAGAAALVFSKNGVALPVNGTTAESTAQTATTTSQATTAPTTQTTTQTTQTTTQPTMVNEDLLLLVNYNHPLSKAYKPRLVRTEYNKEVDARAKAALEKMLDDCRAAGHKPLLCSAYRSVAFQKELLTNKIDSLRRQGYSEAAAKKEASVWIASPGTSEHHTGLAVDIVDINYQLLDEKQEDTATQKWLMQNCYKYGFILRYPTDKKAVTHINYEPWHYRYVGAANAKKITASGLCLEEYLAKLKKQKRV